MVSSALRLFQGYGKTAPVQREDDHDPEVPAGYKLALDHMSQGLCVFDKDERVILVNSRFAALYGLTTDQVKPGTTFSTIVAHLVSTGNCERMTPEEYQTTHPYSQSSGSWDQHLINGRIVRLVRTPLADGGWVSTHEDVTEYRQSEARAAHLAANDPLTGIGNRLFLRERLDLALSQALRGVGVALLWINVDQFRCINDYYSLSVGDAVLKEVANRLKRCAHTGDSIARFGADEFAVVQVGVNDPNTAANFARTVLDALGKPYVVNGQNIVTGVSVGISLAPGDALDAEQLIKNATAALNAAKADGRQTFRFFQPEMDVAIRSRQRMEGDLRHALASGDFEAVYQPIVDLKSERVTTVEALVRWHNKDGEIVNPNAFILVAEESGLIRPIGAWMLHRACTDAAQWPEDVTVAVNLSAAQFRGTKLTKLVADVLAETGLPASRLELEITETLFYGDEATVRRELQTLKEMGVRIAMDDFGTGYSSLSLLSTFPFDKIKIDRSFIKDVDQQRSSLVILRSVAALGLDLGITTTAEGVETRAQLEIVRREGCTEVQGFFFSPPVAADSVVTCIKACAQRMAIHSMM